MNEGAVTLIPDGTIFYCNPRFAEMVGMDAEKLIGVRLQDLIAADQQQHFETMFREAGREGLRSEFCLQHGKDECVPVQLSFFQLRADDASGIAIIATDVTERIQAEEKIRSLVSDLTIAEQEERHRISQVLHDDLQQRLFAIRAQLSSLVDALKNNHLSSDMHVSIDQVQSWLSEAINITRNLSVDISPSVLQGEGISEALSWLSSRMKEQYGLRLKLEVRDELPHLQDHMRVTLFQAVRELLFNVVKHSGTLEATVTLEKLERHGRITISDEGRGFDAKTILADPQATHGLMILRDRLNLMGGTVQIESAPGNGTRAKIDFPIENPS
jgi:PAS domain S-box-containing protein